MDKKYRQYKKILFTKSNMNDTCIVGWTKNKQNSNRRNRNN